jgi:LysR family glycine cleavage system transcriptional activator
MPKRILPPLTALRAFEAFARHGKMSLAADELCVTHGAVSRQVRSLERECGVRLTQGPRNALRLTDAGRRMAVALAETFDQIERTYVDVRAGAGRELHVSCVGTLAVRWLIPRLTRFHERNPDFSVRVTEAYGAVDFAREPYGAAIRLSGGGRTEGVQSIPFLENYHGPVLAPSTGGERLAGLDDLARIPRLHTRPHLQAWSEWAQHAGVVVPDAVQHHEFEHLFYMLEAAAAGLGVGVSPWIYVAGDVASGRLTAPFGFVRTPARFHLLTPEGPPSPALAAFTGWLVDEARAAPPAPPLRIPLAPAIPG